ncbi:protoporphyrinogen oxidase [Nibricoccus sp. IMCC34717]|uniref:protoporphyrinogen oxidase n=1 Tax=Nibricoccus sp. IMCC34717 TaxID=3034021 RepID=UPI00384A68B7
MFRPDPSPLASPAGARLPVAVLGAGITGLTAAYRLHRAGVPVRLFEATDRAGGAICSFSENGWLREGGPNTLQLNSKSLLALIEELGLTPRLLTAIPAAKRRYLLRKGRPCAAPSSPVSFLTTPLFSARGKLRLLRDLVMEPRLRPQDVPLAELVAEHFGDEVVNHAFNAFVSGVYAGDASKLSARLSFPTLWRAERQYGSLLRGLIKLGGERRRQGHPRTRLISFETGLQELPNALAAALPAGTLETSANVVHLNPPRPGGAWGLRWERDGTLAHENFSAVVCALPAQRLCQLTFGPDALTPFAALEAVQSPPVTSLFLGFHRDQVAHPLDGFGMLVPPCENRSVLGVLFSSTLFPQRAPAGHVALTVMVGGSLRPEIAALPTAELLATVRAELGSMLGVSGEPVFVRRQDWPRAIPQYTLDYQRFLDAIEVTEHTYAGLFVGGQLRNGIAVPQCIEAGERLAERCLA